MRPVAATPIGFAVDERQRGEVLIVQEEQIEQEEDQPRFGYIGGVLDQVKGGSTIRRHAAVFTVEVGILHSEPGDGRGNGRVLRGPVVAPTSEDVHSARIEPRVHAVSVELDLVKPIGTVQCFLDEGGKLRLYPGRR